MSNNKKQWMVIYIVMIAGLIVLIIALRLSIIAVHKMEDEHNINYDHYILMEQGKYNYCPYCGEKLNNE